MVKNAPGKAERNGISLLDWLKNSPTKNLRKSGWKTSSGRKSIQMILSCIEIVKDTNTNL